MKSPLRYQATEYDCGPTTMTNAIMFLFEREEIPPDLIRHIGQCTLDSFDDKGHCGRFGTSGAAVRYFGSWLNELRYGGLLPIESSYVEKEQVVFDEDSELTLALKTGAAIVLHVYLNGAGHYILITGCADRIYHVFDPYFTEPDANHEILAVRDHPYSHNLDLPDALLNDESGQDYSMGKVATREALIIRRHQVEDLYVI